MRVTEAELLQEVKSRIGVTGTYHDTAISGYIQDAKDFMVDGGVPESIMETNKIIGAVTRGVSDLWNNGSNNGDFSPYFIKRVTQLAFSGGE